MPILWVVKSVKNFNSRCKIRQEIHHLVQENKTYLNKVVHLKSVSKHEEKMNEGHQGEWWHL